MPAARRRALLCLPLAGALLSGCLDEALIKQPDLVISPGLPAGWSGSSTTAGVGLTTTEHKSGTTAAYLSGAFQQQLGTYVLTQTIRADDYRGKRVQLTAWVKPRNVTNTINSGLWMRVDGPGLTLQFDNMNRRVVSGYGDWRQVSVVLDVPTRAIGIAFGALFQASNTLLVDDMQLKIVDSTVTSTNTMPTPQAIQGQDSAATVAVYERRPLAPVNLDFEGLTPFSSTTSTWIVGNSTALTTTDPTASLDDLEPLRSMIGNAHVVGLGEATHGTKEFALLKDRMVRFLVSRMGFTTFAIEATSPEADDLNEYLRTGVGNPDRLLSHLYFWTWNTREVANMIAWMRQWNSTAPANAQVQFRGIDIQYPAASIDSVVAFVSREAPSLSADIVAKYVCLAPYKNTGNVTGRSAAEYRAQSTEARQLCAEASAAALELVRARSVNAVGYQRALHHARLVQQFEAMIAVTPGALSNQVRDAAMAENVSWLRDQGGANARVVVWAHNDHISRQSTQMGGGLNARFADDYRALAFAFGTGTFNAVKQTETTFESVVPLTSSTYPNASIEDAFMGTNAPLLLLDMRKTSGSDPAGRVLRGPIAMRSIGCCYDPTKESQYFGQLRLFPVDYDLLVFVRAGTASTLLPYVN